MSGEPLRVFGYGSLIFKAPPHAVARHVGYIKGFARRFAQSSNDHRGTPEDPGRVVTIIHANEWNEFAATHPAGAADAFPEDQTVWGTVYEIDREKTVEVKAYLDYREKNGYSEDRVDVYGMVDGKEQVIFRDVLIYVGRLDNPAFVGPEPLDQLARHILTHAGPSGPNREYLYNLVKHVRLLCPESRDHYLETLEARVRRFEQLEHEQGTAPAKDDEGHA